MIKPFDPSRPCTTADGRPVTIEHVDERRKYPILATIHNPTGIDVPVEYMNSGFGMPDFNASTRLINVPEKHTRWVNVWQSVQDGIQTGAWYKSKEDADRVSNPDDRIACIRIEFTEGDGL